MEPNRLEEVALSYDSYVSAQLQEQADQSALRYVFAPFDKMLIFFPTGIPPLEPGRIHLIPHLPQAIGMPYLELMYKDRPFNPKEVNYKPGTQSGEHRIPPAPTVDMLTSRYGEQGCIQVKRLYNLQARAWQQLDLNGLIFEGKELKTPEAFLAQFDRVRERLATMDAKGSRAEFIETVQRLVPQVLEELEASVLQASGWAKTRAEDANAARANGELKKFSEFERKLFRFSGVTPHDQAMNTVAENNNSAIAALPAIVEKLVASQSAVAQQPVIDWKEFGKGLAEGLKESGIVLAQVAAPVPASVDAKKPEEQKNGRR